MEHKMAAYRACWRRQLSSQLLCALAPQQQQMACYMPFKSSLYEFNSLAEKVGRRFALLLSHDLMGPCACAGKQRQKLCGQHKCAWILSQLA